MLLSDMHPFVRFAQILSLDEKSCFSEIVALDTRLFFVQNGRFRIRTGEKELLAKKEDLLIIPSGIPYRIRSAEEKTNLLQINFDYDMRASAIATPVIPVKREAFRADLLLSPEKIEDCPALSQALHLSGMGALEKRLSNLICEYSYRLSFFKEKMSALLTSCIIDAVRAAQMMPISGKSTVTERVIDFIHKNFTQPLTNRSIADIFNYHPNYISHLIKTATGLPLHKYLIHARLSKATSLLQNTSLSVDEIARACGFCDLAYFSGYFKRAYGVGPSKFRNA